LDSHYDAIIIGAGIIGACTALELCRRGFRTLNIDKQAAAGYGSTANSCAIIRTLYSTHQGTALAWESYHHWKHWADFLGANDEAGLVRFVETGILAIKNDAAAVDRIRQFHVDLGIPCELWHAAVLHERMPFLDLRSFAPPKRPDAPDFGSPTGERINGALYVSAGGYINDPILAVHNVQRAAEAAGGEFLFREQVRKIRRAGSGVCGVTTRHGRRIDAPVVINAAGPHSHVINQMARVTAGMRIRTRPLRHEVHCTPAPGSVDYDRAGMVISDDDIGGYSRPEVGNKMLIGSLEPACDELEWVDDPDTFNREVTLSQWEAQVYRVAQRLPGLPIPTHPQGIADLYDVSDDFIPVYDKSDLSGFYMAVGTSGNQFKNAPVVGRMMAELVAACENGHDHDRDPLTIEGAYTGASIDLGFYSRLREINRESSFSVLG